MQEVVAYMTAEEEAQEIKRAYRRLLRSIKTKRTKEQTALIRKAYQLAVKAHQKQRRKSGEPYILHPIEVARICAGEIGLGTTVVISALLHDVVEDTEVTLAEIKEDFGAKVASIVDGLTKFDNIFKVASPQAENFRKILSTLAEDARVVLIKMADRLHNMRTLGSMPIHKQLKIASETKYIYAPLAHRLGLYNMKTEFQDICMRILEPENYYFLEEKLESSKAERTRYVNEFIKPIKKRLNKTELKGKYKIFGRHKAISSIWNKMQKKDVQFEEVYDLFAVRVIIDVEPEREKLSCWMIYSVITDEYQPIPERLKDWVATPKSNGYESLHTTVVGPRGRYVEVQVRSERMDEIAEKGLAAHWKYKEVKTERVFDRWLSRIREVLDNPAEDALQFMDDFKDNLFIKEVYVFTPKGEMKILPNGATALDFAFGIHTEVGYHCTAIKVNKKLVSMDYVLKNGDQIYVTTSRNQKPTEDWLKMVKTSKAKTRIRKGLNEEKRQRAEFGKEMLMRKLKNFKANFNDYNIDFLVGYFKFNNRIDFYYALAQETINLQEALKKLSVEGGKLEEYKPFIFESRLEKADPIPISKPKQFDTLKLLINGEDASKIDYELATCCNPLQGDNIFAYPSKTGIKIHRRNCPNSVDLLSKFGHRVMQAHWGDSVTASFVADLEITGVDKMGVIQSLTNTITNKLHVDMRGMSIDADAGYYRGRISVVVFNTDQLQFVIQTLKTLEGVNTVTRME